MPVLEDLVQLSRFLGDPSRELAILAEGNASARDGETFWVKASGFQLNSMEASGLIQVSILSANQFLNGPDLSDEDTREALKAVRTENVGERMPSVETFMHAYLLTLPDVNFVGHTHPTPLLSLLSTADAKSIASQRLFPDEIVCCGPESAFVPYVDPGLPLAKAIKKSVEEYIAKWEDAPKTIWLENHGLIALGKNPKQVESATAMAVKAARVWLGTLSTGRNIKTLTTEQVKRIHTRPDEHYRQRLLAQLAEGQA